MRLTEGQIQRGLEQLAGRDPSLSPKKEETRRRIIASASNLLLSRPLRRISMDEIAEGAGVSRATLYLYAKSKEDLVVRALAEEQLEHRRTMQDDELPPRTRVEKMIIDALLNFERMPLLSLLVKGDPDLLRSLEHRTDVREAFGGVDDAQLFADAVSEAFPSAPLDRTEALTAVFRALSTVGPHLVEAAPGMGLASEALAENFASLLVNGIESFRSPT